MKVTDAQLDEYVSLYEREYGEKLERTRALTQLHKLINLVLYMAMPEEDVNKFEEELGREYTNSAALK